MKKLILVLALCLFLCNFVSALPSLNPASETSLNPDTHFCLPSNAGYWTVDIFESTTTNGQDLLFRELGTGGVPGCGSSTQVSYNTTNPYWTVFAGYPTATTCIGYYINNGYVGTPHAAVTFSVTEAGDATKMISGAVITLSNTQTNTTGSNGTAFISVTPNSSSYLYSVTKTGYYPIVAAPLGAYGEIGGTLGISMTPMATSAIYNSILWVVDSQTFFTLSDVTVGIKNTTNNIWRNSTVATGYVSFDSTGAAHEYPLAIGQTVGYGASATGYQAGYETVTLSQNNQQNYLALTRNGNVPVNGTWNVNVHANDMNNGAPISGLVTVESGVNGVGSWSQGTDSITGIASFFSLTPSTGAIVSLVAQQYQSGCTKAITVTPNATQEVYLTCLKTGQTPSATMIPTNVVTAVPRDSSGNPTSNGFAQPTDSHGQPITDASGKGFAAFGILVDAAYTIMMIVVGLLVIWLMWMAVYLITGGNIITKIMRRGRR